MFHIVVVLTIDKFVQHFQLSHSGIRLTSSDLKKKKVQWIHTGLVKEGLLSSYFIKVNLAFGKSHC